MKSVLHGLYISLLITACLAPFVAWIVRVLTKVDIIAIYNDWADKSNKEQDEKWLEANQSGFFNKYMMECLLHGHLYNFHDRECVKSSDGTPLVVAMYCPRCGVEHGEYKCVSTFNRETGEIKDYAL